MRESHVVTVAALHLKVCVVNTALQIRESPRVIHERRTGHSRRLAYPVVSLDSRFPARPQVAAWDHLE